MAKAATTAESGSHTSVAKKDICGIIMPISAMPPDYDAVHWADVRRVLDDAVDRAGMQPQIVSDSFESDVIQRRIVHNLYNNPVVICDVSGLNANVMFELGMRLTFKKPVVIVTDDVSSIPFDTRIIEHIPYPRDLHIHKTHEFINKLVDRINSLKEQSLSGNFKSYLESFGTFEIFQPSTEHVPGDKYIAERLDDLMRSVSRLEQRAQSSSSNVAFFNRNRSPHGRQFYRITLPTDSDAMRVANEIEQLRGVLSALDVSNESQKAVSVMVEANMPSGARDMLEAIGKASGGLVQGPIG